MSARAAPREPQRTCIACRRVRPKRELLRVVRRPDGSVAADPQGTAPGRGAYVCPDGTCAPRALRRLGGALRAERIDFDRMAGELSGAR